MSIKQDMIVQDLIFLWIRISAIYLACFWVHVCERVKLREEGRETICLSTGPSYDPATLILSSSFPCINEMHNKFRNIWVKLAQMKVCISFYYE